MTYIFDWNDVRSPLTVLNVIMIICFGSSFAWIGITVALLGLIKDFTKDKLVSSAVMHFSNLLLNLYILLT